jgi:tetratricopeptide (TPR) repeat protein
MSRLAQGLSIAVIAMALAACGSKSKGGKTTPGGTGGGKDAVGMQDGEQPGGGEGGTGGDQGAGGGDQGGGDGSVLPGEGGPEGEGGAKEPETPKYAPPNLDPDPEDQRSAVQSHLKKGRDALRGQSPQPDTAISEAKQALAIDGTSIDAVAIMAHAYVLKKLYDTAETVLDMLMKDRKDAAERHPGVFFVYGLVYDKTDQAAKAFVAYQTAVKLKPDYGSALINLGVHQLRNKQYGESIETYEKLSQLGYDDAKTWNSLGAAYRGRSGDYDPGSAPRDEWLLKAENAFKRATQADKNYGPAYYNLGLLYLDADPYPQPGGGQLDTLVRLNKAKAYFEEYKNAPGVDMKLFDERMKNVTKLISREEKKRKKPKAEE